MASSLKIEERFAIDAPIDEAWAFLLDPEKVVVCVPGAELTDVENERTFHGAVKVKVGQVTIAYKGVVELTEVDEAARRIVLGGKGKEKGGAGSARVDLTGVLTETAPGACEAVVEAEIQLSGTIVRFGRGMIQSVSKQLFKQFVVQLRADVEAAAARPPALDEGIAALATADEAASTAAAGDASPVGGAVEPRPAAPRVTTPIRVLPLLVAALRDAIRGLFARLFGRG